MEKEEKERNYFEVMNAFLKSSDDSTYSKEEVIEIIEAFQYKDAINELKSKKKLHKTVVVSDTSMRRLSPSLIRDLFLKYIFFSGVLILVNQFIYPNIFNQTFTPFVVAGVFVLFSQLLRSVSMVLEFITFPFHRTGVVSLLLYSGIFYLIIHLIERNITTLKFGEAIITVMLVLFVNGLFQHIQNRLLMRQCEMDDDFIEGSEEDE